MTFGNFGSQEMMECFHSRGEHRSLHTYDAGKFRFYSVKLSQVCRRPLFLRCVRASVTILMYGTIL